MDISFNKLSDYPIAIEETALCLLDNNHLVAIGGFNTGTPGGIHSEYYKNKNMSLFKKFFNFHSIKKYVRGFKSHVFLFSIPTNKWSSLPSYPGEPRQAIRSININGSIYTWGGFSYSPTANLHNIPMNKWPNKRNFKAHIDGYVLHKQDSVFFWEKLPNLPLPLSNFAICHLNNKIFICCGGTHHPTDNKGKLDVIINNKNINEHLWSFDINTLKWQTISIFPGTPRINPSCSIINNEIFIIGGLYINPLWTYQSSHVRFYSVLDNWKFNLSSNQWSRLVDTPIHNGNFGSNHYNVYDNRFIILLGGAYFPKSIIYNNIIPTVRESTHTLPDFEVKLNTILIYDTLNNSFFQSNQPLFNYTNLPSYIINKNDLYALAGEQIPFVFEKTYYGCQSDLFIHGKITST